MPSGAGAKETRKHRAKVQNNEWGLQHIITGMLVVYVVPKRKQNGHVAQRSRLPVGGRGLSRGTVHVHRQCAIHPLFTMQERW